MPIRRDLSEQEAEQITCECGNHKLPHERHCHDCQEILDWEHTKMEDTIVIRRPR
jgi:hypothetical protein